MILSHERDFLTHEACYFVYFWHVHVHSLTSFYLLSTHYPLLHQSRRRALIHIIRRLVFFYSLCCQDYLNSNWCWVIVSFYLEIVVIGLQYIILNGYHVS